MTNIQNPDYNELEQRVGLLLHIGRDIKRRGEAGFNVDVELKATHLVEQGISGQERFQAYEWLQKKKLIIVTNSETIEDMDGSATFVEVDLTNNGSKLYEEAERRYEECLNSLKESFS
jgi:hypothetical protein